ncbi:MAG: MFS transporter [Acidimicrobiia bacterium]|nr:MAG: MFS transporter [Acidimicrobiia bacterium]
MTSGWSLPSRAMAIDQAKSTEPTLPEGIDYSKKWYVLVAIAMAIFLGTVDGTMLNVALPTLVEDFDTTFAVAQWVVLSYLLTQTTLTLGFGRLGDMFGKKPIFTAGFVVFIVGSLLAAVSPTITFLIGARIFQAVGAAMIFALGFAITTEAFPPSERGRALGINGTVASLGIMAGPIIGGLVLEAASWQWIFLVNIPIGIIGIIAALKFVPNTKPTGAQSFDFVGAGLFFVALLALLLGLTYGQEIGFVNPVNLALFGTFVGALVTFVIVERRTEHPMLDLSLFENRDVSVNLVTGFVGFFALSGLLLIAPFYLTDVIELSPRSIGLVLAAIPITMGIVSPLAGGFSDRIGSRPVTVVGLVVMTLGYTTAAFLLEGATTAAAIFLVGLIVGLGVGIFNSPNNSAILGSVSQDKLGVTSGLLTITRTTGMVTGIAVLGTLWAARTVTYAGGGTAADAPAAAQAGGFADAMAAAAFMLAASVALGWWAWRSRESPILSRRW